MSKSVLALRETGGLEGGVRVGYVGGLCKAAVTGLRAGEHIAGARDA